MHDTEQVPLTGKRVKNKGDNVCFQPLGQALRLTDSEQHFGFFGALLGSKGVPFFN